MDIDQLKKTLLIKLYKEYGTITAVAKFLNMNRKTLNSYYRKYNIPITKGHPKNTSHKKWNSLMKWYKENQITLPRSVTKIAKLSGCSIDSVKCFFYRKRKEMKNFIASLPDLRKTQIKIKGIFPINYAKSYELTFDKWTMKLKITLYLKPTGKRTISYNLTKEELEKGNIYESDSNSSKERNQNT